MINIITYDDKTVQALFDALLYDAVTDDGVLQGMDVNLLSTGNTIDINNGYGIIQGRVFKIEQESVQVTLTPGSSTNGQVIIKIDLSNDEEPITIFSDNTMRPLEQDSNFNVMSGIYEVQYCTYTVTGSGIGAINQTFNRVTTQERMNQSIKTLNSNVQNLTTQLSQLITDMNKVKEAGVFWKAPGF